MLGLTIDLGAIGGQRETPLNSLFGHLAVWFDCVLKLLGLTDWKMLGWLERPVETPEEISEELALWVEK